MTKFDVGGNKISGNAPHSFFRLSKVEYLDLSKNQLTGSIPPITSVSLRLASLTLDNNRFEGLIPESLSMMNGLQSLRLNNNLFAGTLPSALGEMKSLVRLYLDSNRMTGTIPSTLHRLTKLKTLYLNSNLLTGTIPVLDQSSLRSVILSENYLTMGSLVVVPSSTFSSSAVAMDIALQSNCLVFRNPSKPSQNADATHCRGERFILESATSNDIMIFYFICTNNVSFATGSVVSSAMPTRKPTAAPSKSVGALKAAAATADGLELFAMAKAIPRLQNFDGACVIQVTSSSSSSSSLLLHLPSS